MYSAEDDLSSAESMFVAGHYNWCLFISHLVLEKALKAHWIAKHNELIPPKIHNLLKLALSLDINFDNEILKFFNLANSFNIEGRYAETKAQLYSYATKDVTLNNLERTKEIFLWLKSLIT